MTTSRPSPLVLASTSPRRAELLRAMGIPFEVVPSTVDESRIPADHPRTFALRAAFAKAKDVAARLPEGRWVLAADTVVAKGPILFGKPPTAALARQVLSTLSNQVHDVITGVALARAGSEETHLDAAQTRVMFRSLTAEEIDEYVASGEPMDKAGAYGIQGGGGDLVAGIEGDYYNVVGLPCALVVEMLCRAGIEIPAVVPPPPARWARRY